MDGGSLPWVASPLVRLQPVGPMKGHCCRLCSYRLVGPVTAFASEVPAAVQACSHYPEPVTVTLGWPGLSDAYPVSVD